MTYLLHIFILIGIYVIVSQSLNLISGYTGLLSIAHAGFYGIGAYVAALMALHWQTNFLLNMACAAGLAGLLGLVVAVPSLRLRGDYFVIATFAFQIIAFSVMNNWGSVTAGPLGLPGIPRPEILGFTFTTHVHFLILVGIFAILAFLFLNRLVHSPYGRVLRAIREDEVFPQSLGKNVTHFKVSVFVIGAAIASIGGALYAHYITFIDPTSFTINESIFILAIVIIGGSGNLVGSIVGATVLIMVPEFLRFVGMPSSIAANMRQILYGGLLVLFMMFMPEGFVGEYAFKKGER